MIKHDKNKGINKTTPYSDFFVDGAMTKLNN